MGLDDFEKEIRMVTQVGPKFCKWEVQTLTPS